MGGKTVDCVRIRKPREVPLAPPKQVKPEVEFDDEIPFN
jgi:hypothetical protein